MKWPWSRHDCNRATLTLLRDDRMVIGFPRDMAKRDMDEMAARLRVVPDGWRVAPFPFPVDVIDQREDRRK